MGDLPLATLAEKIKRLSFVEARRLARQDLHHHCQSEVLHRLGLYLVRGGFTRLTRLYEQMTCLGLAVTFHERLNWGWRVA